MMHEYFSSKTERDIISREELLLKCAQDLERQISALLGDRDILQQSLKESRQETRRAREVAAAAKAIADNAAAKARQKEERISELSTQMDQRQALLEALEKEVLTRKGEAEALLKEVAERESNANELEKMAKEREDATALMLCQVKDDQKALQVRVYVRSCRAWRSWLSMREYG